MRNQVINLLAAHGDHHGSVMLHLAPHGPAPVPGCTAYAEAREGDADSLVESVLMRLPTATVVAAFARILVESPDLIVAVWSKVNESRGRLVGPTDVANAHRRPR